MSLETLDLLATPTQATASLALASLASLSSAPAQLQHKIAVRISALLKSKSAERAFATLMAARALAHPEIVKTHAATWCPILLHMLDLPNPETWNGAIKALCVLFTVTDLREIGGVSKIADFVKRLIPLIHKIPTAALTAICHLCNTHPTPLRNYIPQITAAAQQTIWSNAYQVSARTLASVVFAEKTPSPTWREQTIALISDIKLLCQEKPLVVLTGAPHSALEPSRAWAMLSAYFEIRPAGCKVPVVRLVETIDIALRSTNVEVASGAIKFVLDTQVSLGSVWAQEFDTIIHSVIETSNYGQKALNASIVCTTSLLTLAKTVPNRYLRALHSLFNRGYNLVYPKIDSQTGLQSIADMLDYQFPEGTRELAVVLSKYAEALILGLDDIPASFRTKLDATLLSVGGTSLRTATLYPGKLSVLPISLEYGLQGYETLVHPRFPPLAEANRSPNGEKNSEYDMLESQAEACLPVVEPVKMVSQVNEETTTMPHVELTPVPQAPTPQISAGATETSSPTLKRDAPAPTPVAKRAKVHSDDNGEGEDDNDDDDDFVIPTIEMDSD